MAFPRGQKLNTDFFSNRDIPPKSLFSPDFEGHTELFGVHPFTWKAPTPPEDILTEQFEFVPF